MRLRPALPLLLALLAACPAPGGKAPRQEDTPPSAGTAAADTTPPLELRFLEVGQGDAVLIRSAGRVALVDAGPSDRVAERLRALGVDTVHLLVASHNHSDHIGGADAVLEGFPVRNYLDNGHPATTSIQKRVLGLVEEEGAGYLQASPRTITLGGAKLRVLPTPPDVGGDEQNNRSVVLLLERGAFHALLSGDSEEEEIEALLHSPDALPDVDVLKAAHHGSRNGVTEPWLARLRPEVVVISAGEGNVYGHPHREALERYCTGGRRVFRTDLHGEVVVTVDTRGRYTVRTEGDSLSATPAAQATACSRAGRR
ncbi:MAG: MBL fold metallo-hydrolase, partial [Gemmatimonadota bacterium]|nr:MBL fold metallo-hydrolase [Gemmatimonadota bacterium]